MGIGRRIRELREINRLSREELGKLVGADPTIIATYEDEDFIPNWLIFLKLIEVFGCDANYLLQDVVNMSISASDITVSEHEMIKRYRELDVYGKINVGCILINETIRCKA